MVNSYELNNGRFVIESKNGKNYYHRIFDLDETEQIVKQYADKLLGLEVCEDFFSLNSGESKGVYFPIPKSDYDAHVICHRGEIYRGYEGDSCVVSNICPVIVSTKLLLKRLKYQNTWIFL